MLASKVSRGTRREHGLVMRGADEPEGGPRKRYRRALTLAPPIAATRPESWSSARGPPGKDTGAAIRAPARRAPPLATSTHLVRVKDTRRVAPETPAESDDQTRAAPARPKPAQEGAKQRVRIVKPT